MKILITAPGQFTCNGDEPKTGLFYNCEPSAKGTDAQNRTFHKLLILYFNSGAYSYPAKTVDDLKEWVKAKLRAGAEYYIYVDTEGKKRKSKTLPDNVMEFNGERYIWQRLLSWSRYTKKQRMETIRNLVQEMITAGVNSREFESILADMQRSD